MTEYDKLFNKDTARQGLKRIFTNPMTSTALLQDFNEIIRMMEEELNK